jgi:hypothetical protein
MSNPEMINIYVEKLILEMSELQKTKILLQAQHEFLQRQYERMKTELEDLQSKFAKSKKKEPQQETF